MDYQKEDGENIEILTKEKKELQMNYRNLKKQIKEKNNKLKEAKSSQTIYIKEIENLTNENHELQKKNEKMENQHKDYMKQVNNKVKELNRIIENKEEEKKLMQEKLNKVTVQLSEIKKNNEKTDILKTNQYQNLLAKEGNDEEILKLEFNNFKENLNKITSTIKIKGKNPEEAADLSILNYLFNKITKIVPKIQNQIEKKCSLICSDLCNHESSMGDSIKKVQLNCGHYFHYECLKSYLAFLSSYIEKEEITTNSEIKCPICYKNTIVL
ncbi:hypothetical protein H8356DRAFT_1746478 [Neocallimastix lanati (nom. inval.)]|nr:hypothetical protein H8356DRAFT_1746478 [Neocallimastix sp. JGI-2020a]